MAVEDGEGSRVGLGALVVGAGACGVYGGEGSAAVGIVDVVVVLEDGVGHG